MILYRYLPLSSALKTIETCSLRFGRVNELNDPFDCLPQKSNDYSDLHSKLHQHFGVICFSEKSSLEHPLLWSHYGDMHRGVALGFDFDEVSPDINGRDSREMIFDSDSPPAVIAANKMEYRVEGDNSRPQAKAGMPVADIALVKGFQWAYEQEWRIVQKFDSFNSSFLTRSNGMFLLPIKTAKLKRIILGAKCNLGHQYLSRDSSILIGSDTLIEQATLHDSEYRLVLNQAG